MCDVFSRLRARCPCLGVKAGVGEEVRHWHASLEVHECMSRLVKTNVCFFAFTQFSGVCRSIAKHTNWLALLHPGWRRRKMTFKSLNTRHSMGQPSLGVKRALPSPRQQRCASSCALHIDKSPAIVTMMGRPARSSRQHVPRLLSDGLCASPQLSSPLPCSPRTIHNLMIRGVHTPPQSSRSLMITPCSTHPTLNYHFSSRSHR